MLYKLKTAIEQIDGSSIDYYKYKDDFFEIYQFISASLAYQANLNSSASHESTVNIEDFVMVLRQLIDKEYIIPYPLIGNWNDKILKWELRNGDVFDKFKYFITMQLINDWTKVDSKGAKIVLSPIRRILNKSGNFKINIFSLNYDLALEDNFNSNHVTLLDNGFSEKKITDTPGRYWTSDFDSEQSAAKINLYKLHGSLDWEYDKNLEEISIKDDIYDAREPLIIFGSYTKMLSFDPFLFILGKFRQVLSKSSIFVIIGYSFHDKYINNLIIQQLSQNTEHGVPKRIIIVNPAYKNKSARQVADELKAIQDNKSINDIINFTHINPDRIILIPLSTSEFYKKYFLGGAKELMQELRSTEKGDQIF